MDSILISLIQKVQSSKTFNQHATETIKISKVTKDRLESHSKLLEKNGIKIPIGQIIQAEALLTEQVDSPKGDATFQIAELTTQLEAANKKIKEEKIAHLRATDSVGTYYMKWQAAEKRVKELESRMVITA